LLHVWTGGDGYEQFDEMYVEDEEWERFVFLFLPSIIHLACPLKLIMVLVSNRVVSRSMIELSKFIGKLTIHVGA